MLILNKKESELAMVDKENIRIITIDWLDTKGIKVLKTTQIKSGSNNSKRWEYQGCMALIKDVADHQSPKRRIRTNL